MNKHYLIVGLVVIALIAPVSIYFYNKDSEPEYQSANLNKAMLDIIQEVFPITWESLNLEGIKCPEQQNDSFEVFKERLLDNDAYTYDEDIQRVWHGWLVANNCPSDN